MHVDCWRAVRRDRMGRAGLTVLALLAGLALLAPLLAPGPPQATSPAVLQPPGPGHWLGTNDVGQDVWRQLLYGARLSLAVGGGAAALALVVSLLLGGAAALLGGVYDRVAMRLVDALLVIPPVLLAILAAAYLRPGPWLLLVLLALFIWPAGARIVRTETLSLQARAPVAAALSFGAGRGHILRRHIIPDLGPILVAVFIQDARRAIFLEAGLSFLGVADPAAISWGKSIQQALRFTYVDAWQWWLLPNALALAALIIGLALVGQALETALNPRLQSEDKHAGD